MLPKKSPLVCNTTELNAARFIVVVATVVCLSVGGSASHSYPVQPVTEPQPLVDLPSGWIHLGAECTDCWMGAYHDSASGAYVSYSVEHPGNFGDWLDPGRAAPGDEFSEGIVNGIPYRKVTFDNARLRVRHMLERGFGDTLENLGKMGEVAFRLLPPANCSLVSVGFILEKENRLFTCAVCTEQQQNRVNALLFQGMRLQRTREAPWRSQSVTMGDYAKLMPGMTFSEARQLLGWARGSYQVSSDSFALIYFVFDGADKGREARLFFDRSQVLVKKELDDL